MKQIINAGKFVIIGLLIYGSFFLSNCAQQNAQESEPLTATIQGKVLETQNGTVVPVPGASIVITRIHSNGLVENVTSAKTYSDRSGYFKLQTEAFDEPHLVIVAKNYDKVWKTTLTDPVHPDSRVSNIILNEETTVETEVFNRLKMSGQHSAVSYSDIRKIVTIEHAQKLVDNAVEIAKMAESIFSRVTDDLGSNISGQSYEDSEFFAGRHETTLSDFSRAAALTTSLTNRLSGQSDEPRILLQVSGDVPLTDDAREILDILAKKFGTVQGNDALKIVAEKTQSVTNVNEEISGALSRSQRELIQLLKQRMQVDFEELNRTDIRLEIRVFLYQPGSKNEYV